MEYELGGDRAQARGVASKFEVVRPGSGCGFLKQYASRPMVGRPAVSV